MVKAVIKVEAPKEFMEYLRRQRYDSLCRFIRDMIAEGGVELGYWLRLPEDIKIVCVEEVVE